MTPGDYVLVLAGGVVAGALNVVAAGGAVVSFVVLTWAGVPAAAANAVNLLATPASFVGTVSGAWRDRRLHARWWPLLLVAGIGTVAGVLAFRLLPPVQFRSVVPVLLLVSAATLIAYPVLRRRLRRRTHSRRGGGTVMTGGIFATSAYAGLYGGGVGVLVLLVLALCTSWPWLEANTLKNVICLVTSIIGAATMALTGSVDWVLAAVLAVALAVGGLAGQWALTWLSRSEFPREQAEDVLRESVMVLAALGAGLTIPAT